MINTISESEESTLSICANCGKGEEASSDLKSCASCKMVKYCSRDCQIAHRPQHKKECKKRIAENLFKDHPPTKECPICMIPLPVDGETNEVFKSCCGKVICSGCQMGMHDDAQEKGKKFEEDLCAFCRKPEFGSNKELIERLKGHMDKENAYAISHFGAVHLLGMHGLPQDASKANELFLKAGELGCASGYYNLARSYENGSGVEVDMKKAKYYHEKAAIMGDVQARCLLGACEARERNLHRANKHLMLAARAGHTVSLGMVKKGFMSGFITKDEYAQTLRAYQKRHDEMKSDARERVAPLFEEMRRRGIA